MTEYGKTLVEAACEALELCEEPSSEHMGRAALLAFLDKLLSDGPSEGMIRAYLREVHFVELDDPDFGGHAYDARTAFEDMSAMLKSLRTEIEESGR